MDLILSVLVTFLPPRYRPEGARLRLAGVVAGGLQMLAAHAFLVYRFIIFSWQRAAIMGPGVDTPSNLPEVNATFGGGVFMMAEFILQPLHIFLLYLVLEGLTRLMAAAVSDQIIGTLPLYAISGIHGLIDRADHRRYVGALVPDQVVRGNGKAFDLKIYSCRAKLEWNPYMSVEFEGQFYQYFREEQGQLPRRFVYFLRKSAPGHLSVVVDHYHPDNVLKTPPDKWAGTPTVWEKLLPNWRPARLVPDEIVRGGGPRQDYDLKVYACRPKADWNAYVTIEFEETWYQLVKNEQGPKDRPYVYYLRNASTTRPAVVIRHYDPNSQS